MLGYRWGWILTVRDDEVSIRFKVQTGRENVVLSTIPFTDILLRTLSDIDSVPALSNSPHTWKLNARVYKDFYMLIESHIP